MSFIKNRLLVIKKKGYDNKNDIYVFSYYCYKLEHKKIQCSVGQQIQEESNQHFRKENNVDYEVKKIKEEYL